MLFSLNELVHLFSPAVTRKLSPPFCYGEGSSNSLIASQVVEEREGFWRWLEIMKHVFYTKIFSFCREFLNYL